MYNSTMNKQPILIVFTKQVTFRDSEGAILRDFSVGDVVSAHDVGAYFITSMGGVYYEEARPLNGLELISYSNTGDETVRFRQYARDTIPPWATNLRIDGI